MSSRSLAGPLLGVVLVLASPALAQPGACTCRHLGGLQTELRNAIQLQAAFRGKIAELRALGAGSAQGEYLRFAAGLEGTVTRPEGDTGPGSVDYTAHGHNVYTGNEAGLDNAALCRPSANAVEELAQAARGAVCAAAADAVRAHESHHQGMCNRLGFVTYRDMHSADRAMEEVEAYGAQIAVLRQAIRSVLERSTVRIVVESNSRFQMPPNPLYTAILIDTDAEVQTSSTTGGDERIRMDGHGEQTTNATIEGNCTLSGVPYTLPVSGGLDTDGLEARVRYTVDGTMPSIGMRCSIPGQGSGHGMSMPAPISGGNVPPELTLALRNGAEVSAPLAGSEAARIVGQGGVSLTGGATLRLFIECPPGE